MPKLVRRKCDETKGCSSSFFPSSASFSFFSIRVYMDKVQNDILILVDSERFLGAEMVNKDHPADLNHSFSCILSSNFLSPSSWYMKVCNKKIVFLISTITFSSLI